MPSRFMISAIAVPSFMTVSLPCGRPVRPADLRGSWNRIFRIGKAEAASAGGSTDMRFAAGRLPCGQGGQLPRLAAPRQHRGQQAEKVVLHRAAGLRLHLRGAPIVVLVADEADIVSFQFTL